MATVLSKIYENICEALLTSQAAAISVDGKGGVKTVKALQKYLGVKQDGVISGQLKDLKKYHPGLTAVKYGKGGSPTVKKMQQWLGIAQDGQWGRNTSIALQKKLGVKQDGIAGAATFKALQKFLNGSQPAPAPTPTPTTNAQKIVARAREYAWPYGTAASKYSYSKGSAKAVYKSALKKYMGKSAKISQTDCGYFVSTCVRASGTSGSFLALPGSYKKSYPSVPSTMRIVSKGGVASLQPGDVIRYRKKSGQHTVIYIGDGLIAHASRKNAFPRVSKSKPWNNSNVKKSTIQVIRAK